MSTRKKWVCGNWKMNGSSELINNIIGGLANAELPNVDVGICPPSVFIPRSLETAAGSSLMIGAQDASQHTSGAYTGEVAASMLAEIGVESALVGHSERRAYHHESNELVAQKAKAVLDAGLQAVICVGETLKEREAGLTEAIVDGQLKAVIDIVGIDAIEKCVIAYEPVWAIGTGLAATPDQAQEVHAFLRQKLRALSEKVATSTRIVYGGSVKPGNAQELFNLPDVDGGLIGGASLKFEDFIAIVNAAG